MSPLPESAGLPVLSVSLNFLERRVARSLSCCLVLRAVWPASLRTVSSSWSIVTSSFWCRTATILLPPPAPRPGHMEIVRADNNYCSGTRELDSASDLRKLDSTRRERVAPAKESGRAVSALDAIDLQRGARAVLTCTPPGFQSEYSWLSLPCTLHDPDLYVPAALRAGTTRAPGGGRRERPR